MGGISEEAVSALISAFVDQVAGHFPGAAEIIGGNKVLLNVGGKAVPVTVLPYSDPDESEPERPWTVRITVSPHYPFLTKSERASLRKLGLPEEQPPRLDCTLEFTMLPEELSAAAPWLAEWIQKQANEDPEPPRLPFRESDHPFFQDSGPDWRGIDYLWSAAAKQVYSSWYAEYRARRADETQFTYSVYEDRYPDIRLPLKPPRYQKPDYPVDWFESGEVEIVNRFRPGCDAGKYLRGPAMEHQLSAACERGYIVLPEDWEESKWWKAWKSTWWEVCQLPKNRRPYVSITVSRDESVFGQMLVLSWDWITMDPKNDPSEDPVKDPRENPKCKPGFVESWKGVFQRISDYVRTLPAPGYDALCQSEPSVTGLVLPEMIVASVGTLVVATQCDEPIRWVFDWMGDYYPRSSRDSQA